MCVSGSDSSSSLRLREGSEHDSIQYRLYPYRHHPQSTYRSRKDADPALLCRRLHRPYRNFPGVCRGTARPSHIYLIFCFHRASSPRLVVKPFLQDVERGVFSTRAPCRPNPVGLSIVRLLGREGNTLHISSVDILDGTPLLDIKPYSTRFDCIEGTRNGWQDEVNEEDARHRGRRGYRSEES